MCFTFFIFYEILTEAPYPLVVHYRDGKAKSAGRKYLLYPVGSGQLFFAAMVFVYFTCGTLDFVPGGFIGDALSGTTALIVFFLMICGGAVKAGADVLVAGNYIFSVDDMAGRVQEIKNL